MIEIEKQSSVSLIAIDREERRNALDIEHCQMIDRAVQEAVLDGARVILITGKGSSFCAGADFAVLTDPAFRGALYGMIRSITTAQIPVIAAMNGPAIGAGVQLSIACDLRVAVPEAYFWLPTAKLGVAVDPWTIRRLHELLGDGSARAMLFGCEKIEVSSAVLQGLVNRIGDRAHALQWAEEIASFAPLTLSFYKQSLERQFGGLREDAELAEAFEATWHTEDILEGQNARLEKRPAIFRGR